MLSVLYVVSTVRASVCSSAPVSPSGSVRFGTVRSLLPFLSLPVVVVCCGVFSVLCALCGVLCCDVMCVLWCLVVGSLVGSYPLSSPAMPCFSLSLSLSSWCWCWCWCCCSVVVVFVLTLCVVVDLVYASVVVFVDPTMSNKGLVNRYDGYGKTMERTEHTQKQKHQQQ